MRKNQKELMDSRPKLVRVRKEVAEGISFYNVRQKRCWALVSADLQKYVDKDIDWTDTETVRKDVPLTPEGNYEVEILPQYVVSKGHSYSGVLETLRKLTEVWVPVKFADGSQEIFVIFNAYRVSTDGRFFAQMNIKSLKLMLDIKRGYFSTFHVESFLKLSTTYSMDLFLYLSQNYNRVGKSWTVSLDELKKRVGCPAGYDFKDIKERILDPSQKEFEKQKTLITFTYLGTYSEASLNKRTRGRRKIDCVAFEIVQNTEL